MAESRTTSISLNAQMTDHAQYLSGIPGTQFYTNAKVMVDVQLVVSEYYGLGGAEQLRPSVSYDIYNIEAEALGQRLVYHDNGMPDVDLTTPLIKTHRDLDRMQAPDPYRDGRMPMILKFYSYLREHTGTAPSVRFCAPFSLAVFLRGYSNLVFDIKRDPSFAHALLETVTERVLVPYISVLLEEAGSGSCAVGAEAWASPPNVTLPILEEYVVPYSRRLQEKLGRVIVRGLWGESFLKDPLRLLELKRQINGDYVYGCDPDAFKLGPRLWKDFAVAHNSWLTLGLDATLLRDGPVEAVLERVKEYVRVGAPGGRFSLEMNNIPADTPSSHIHAVVAAAAAFGNCTTPGEYDQVRVVVPERESFAEFAAARGLPARPPAR